MARTKGALHSDSAIGTLNGVTHRTYRGVGVASSKRILKARHQVTPKLTSPQDIDSCFARYNLGQGVTLTPPPGTQYVISIEDLVGGLGKLENLIPGAQPRFYSSHLLHNNRPYCYFDGANDRLRTVELPIPIEQPIEIWMVASGPLNADTTYREFLCFKTGSFNTYRFLASPIFGHIAHMGLIRKVSELHDSSIFLTRLVLNKTATFAEWNGTRQLPDVNCGSGNFNCLMVASRWNTAYARFNLFEICIFLSILKPTERQLLTNWYLEWFNLP